jgi:hypothetical protein
MGNNIFDRKKTTVFGTCAFFVWKLKMLYNLYKLSNALEEYFFRVIQIPYKSCSDLFIILAAKEISQIQTKISFSNEFPVKSSVYTFQIDICYLRLCAVISVNIGKLRCIFRMGFLRLV